MKKIIILFAIILSATTLIHAQGKMALGINGGVALPLGDFGDGFDMGFGGNAIFIYHTSPNSDVTVTVGYLTWSGKDSSDLTFSSIPVMVGGKYLFGKGKFNPYINGELGVHFATAETPEYVINGQTYGGSVSDTYFGWGAGGGFLYKLGQNMNLDFNVRYNGIASEGNSSNYVSILVGLLFGLK